MARAPFARGRVSRTATSRDRGSREDAEELRALPFGARAQLAAQADWAPNPKAPPLFSTAGEGRRPAARRAGAVRANARSSFIDPGIGNLSAYRAIAIATCGDPYGLPSTRELHEPPAPHRYYGFANASRPRARHEQGWRIRSEHVLPSSIDPVRRQGMQ